ncbi:MAG TPA: phosphate acyltransferase PlsX [Anaerolineaceae bacterium]|nr:phosphate acyltransferase PlsX [Anaerolineaceae bacterium]
MAIILDAMGSDNYPDPEIFGAIEAAEQMGEEVILVGNQELLEPKLKAANTRGAPVSIEHAPDMVEMADKVVASGRAKPNNSMAIGCKLVKIGRGSAFVTAGSTGAAMFNAWRTLGKIKGVLRPALCAIAPTKTGRCVITDIGANADCRPEFLAQFAILGSIYAQKALNIANPRIGLLSNGEEAGKGNQLVKDTYPLMEKLGLNFIGNVEGKEVFGGFVDVVVTDGFTGNVMMKGCEAVARLITDTLKTELTSSFTTKIGALLAKSAFKKVRNLVDPSAIGAAPLLGIDGLVLVGHGRSDARAITSSLLLAQHIAKADMLNSLRDAIQASMELVDLADLSRETN